MTAAPNNAHLQPGVIAEFDSARATPRQIAASFTLDQTVPHDQPGPVSLRFIYMNIIGEHARHAEHADILRERSWTPRARPYDSTRPVTTGNVSRQSPDAYQDQQRTAPVFLCATLPRTQTNSPDSRPRCRSTATQSVPTPSARKRGSTIGRAAGRHPHLPHGDLRCRGLAGARRTAAVHAGRGVWCPA
jgi:hypothetical protein